MILFRVITNTVQKLQVPPLMESSRCMQNSPEDLPHLLHYIKSNAVTGFDNVEDTDASNCLHQQIATASTIPSPDLTSVKGKEASSYQWNACSSAACLPKSSIQANDSLRLHSISISMPSSPAGLTLDGYERIYLGDKGGTNANHVNSNPAANPSISNIRQPKKTIFHSQPMPARGRFMDHSGQEQENSSNVRMNDNPYDSFKTWSRKFERKTSHLHAKQQEPAPEVDHSQNAEVEALPVDRYFDALEGPELDTLRASEELVLPEDKKWPFLLRFPISTFGICLGISSQAILWKTLATSTSMSFLHVSPSINIFLWCISVSVTAIVSLIYSLKLIFYFEAVRREYCHPIRVNFFFAPWIAFLFLVLGVPSPLAEDLHASLWYLLMAPILCLELKIYGQWMSGGQRRLSKVANPSNHLSVIGNFVGALLGASMGLKEGPIFFFAVGLAHYLVLFVTLYQRLPTNETLPKELHPVFFLFVAAPSIASTAWARIQDGFDYGSKFAYFIALFLYFSLAVRVNFFWGFRFSLAWWAYTFPMTGASIATIKYSDSIRNPFTQTLSITLSTISALTVTALLISTLFHALVLRNLFPNDIAIAISERTPKENKKCLHPLSANSNKKDNESSTESICH